jgi:truncated hemoglobin YjbI/predicted pyridoxine 5'-phosphate oxidase superfamily flavin-nucleotide-binding protein
MKSGLSRFGQGPKSAASPPSEIPPSGLVAGQPSNTKAPETSPPPGGVPQSSKKFGFMRGAGEVPIAAHPAATKTVDTAGNGSTLSASAPSLEKIGACPAQLKNPSLLPGSDGEHILQMKYGSKDRAQAFYGRQVLSFLSPLMREFIAKQEFLFVATADRHGECDCTSKFGEPGFIRVLGDKHVLYPEFRGNGVFANLGNLSENPHIGMLILDCYRDSVGLHINGKARAVENEELSAYADKLPKDVVELFALEGTKRPERWVMVEVEEAYIQCSKHVPLVQKKDRTIDWGTDSVAAKKGDYFQILDIPLYDRLGGDDAMEIVVDIFYRKVLGDDFVSRFFEDVDMAGQRLKQKAFLAMAFGGPYPYTKIDLRKAHGRLVTDMGLNDQHFDRVAAILKETLQEADVGAKETEEVLQVIESAREDILGR